MNNIIHSHCYIIPLEISGRIIGIYTTANGREYNVRYYWNGEQKNDTFFDYEIKVEDWKNDTNI